MEETSILTDRFVHANSTEFLCTSTNFINKSLNVFVKPPSVHRVAGVQSSVDKKVSYGIEPSSRKLRILLRCL